MVVEIVHDGQVWVLKTAYLDLEFRARLAGYGLLELETEKKAYMAKLAQAIHEKAELEMKLAAIKEDRGNYAHSEADLTVKLAAAELTIKQADALLGASGKHIIELEAQHKIDDGLLVLYAGQRDAAWADIKRIKEYACEEFDGEHSCKGTCKKEDCPMYIKPPGDGMAERALVSKGQGAGCCVPERDRAANPEHGVQDTPTVSAPESPGGSIAKIAENIAVSETADAIGKQVKDMALPEFGSRDALTPPNQKNGCYNCAYIRCSARATPGIACHEWAPMTPEKR